MDIPPIDSLTLILLELVFVSIFTIFCRGDTTIILRFPTSNVLDEKLSTKLLTIQWKQQACIETGAQLSKTFMPLKPLDEFGSDSAQSENSRFVVLAPVENGDQRNWFPESRLVRTGRVEISSLQLNCHYEVYVAPHKRKSNDAILDRHTDQPSIPVGCLCTPACFNDQSVPWASHFSCSSRGTSFLLKLS